MRMTYGLMQWVTIATRQRKANLATNHLLLMPLLKRPCWRWGSWRQSGNRPSGRSHLEVAEVGNPTTVARFGSGTHGGRIQCVSRAIKPACVRGRPVADHWCHATLEAGIDAWVFHTKGLRL